MKKLLLPILLLFVSIAEAQIEKVIPDPTMPPRLVVDFTSTLTFDQRESLESKLVAYDDSTSNQIVVVIVPSTGDYDISDYALALGRKWGVGGKEFNNGIVFLIAKNDRKLWIATGYGLGLRLMGSKNIALGGAAVAGAAGGALVYALNSAVPEVAAIGLHNYVAEFEDPASVTKEDIEKIASRYERIKLFGIYTQSLLIDRLCMLQVWC